MLDPRRFGCICLGLPVPVPGLPAPGATGWAEVAEIVAGGTVAYGQRQELATIAVSAIQTAEFTE